MTTSSTSTVQQNSGTSSKPSDPAVEVTTKSMELQPSKSENASWSVNHIIESWKFILAGCALVIAGIVYFFVTIMGIKDQISVINTSTTEMRTQQSSMQLDIVRIDKSMDKLNLLSTEVAVLKDRLSNSQNHQSGQTVENATH